MKNYMHVYKHISYILQFTRNKRKICCKLHVHLLFYFMGNFLYKHLTTRCPNSRMSFIIQNQQLNKILFLAKSIEICFIIKQMKLYFKQLFYFLINSHKELYIEFILK